MLVVLRWHHENIVAANFELELWQRPLRRALERCASPRVEPAVVAGTFDLPLVRLVKHRAGKMRALLLKGTPFVIAEIDQDIGQSAARKRERVSAADGHVLFLADEMLAGDWRMRKQLVAHGDPCAARQQALRDHKKVFRKLAPRHVLGFDAVDREIGSPSGLRRQGGFDLFIHGISPQPVQCSLWASSR